MTRNDLVEMLLPVVERLDETGFTYVLIGGTTVPFYLPEEMAQNVRPTKDIDIIVAAIKLTEFHRIEESLRKTGFKNHPEVRHRWLLGEMLIDVLPMESEIMDTINRWYPITFRTAEAIEIAPEVGVLIASPACFLATKMEAFINRGRGDFLASHDLEDFLTVVDGRESLLEEIARHCPPDVRDFLRVSVRQLLRNSKFIESMEGHLPPLHRNEHRLERLLERLKTLAT